MSFISKYLTHTSIYESPLSFWKFSAYATISAVLRDSIWRKQGDKFVFPNLYILLLADSAVQRKGNPIELCEKLVTEIGNTKVIAGRSSVQAIFDVLGTAETDSRTGALRKGGAAVFFAPELSAGIVNDPQSVSVLTDLYDYKEKYKEHLRGKGITTIDKIVFSLFAGSNETLLKAVYNSDAIHGGLLGRTLVVKPDEFRKASSLLNVPDTSASYKLLLSSLQEIISNVKGEVVITPQAMDHYNTWYISFREGYRTRVDSTGVAGRMHMTVLKLSMVLAANENTRFIEEKHIEEAIETCIALLPNYKTFTISSGKGNMAQAGGTLVTALLEAPPIYKLSRREILRQHWQDIDSETLDKLVVTLEEAGFIKTIINGAEITYELTKKALLDMGIKV